MHPQEPLEDRSVCSGQGGSSTWRSPGWPPNTWWTCPASVSGRCSSRTPPSAPPGAPATACGSAGTPGTASGWTPPNRWTPRPARRRARRRRWRGCVGDRCGRRTGQVPCSRWRRPRRDPPRTGHRARPRTDPHVRVLPGGARRTCCCCPGGLAGGLLSRPVGPAHRRQPAIAVPGSPRLLRQRPQRRQLRHRAHPVLRALRPLTAVRRAGDRPGCRAGLPAGVRHRVQGGPLARGDADSA